MKRLLLLLLACALLLSSAGAEAVLPDGLREFADAHDYVEMSDDGYGSWCCYALQFGNEDPGPDGEVLLVGMAYGTTFFPNDVKPIGWINLRMLDREGEVDPDCVFLSLTYQLDKVRYIWDAVIPDPNGPTGWSYALIGQEQLPFLEALRSCKKGSISVTCTLNGETRTRKIDDADNIGNMSAWADGYLQLDLWGRSDQALLNRFADLCPMRTEK